MVYLKNNEKLEMCQYDIDAPAQGHTRPYSGICEFMVYLVPGLAKNEVKTGP